MRISATKGELLDMLARHSAEAEGMLGGTCPPDQREEARMRVRLEHRLLHKAVSQVSSVSVSLYEEDDEEETYPADDPRVRRSRRERVQEWFETHPEDRTRPRDLMKALDDDNPSGISQALKQLMTDGKIERVTRGVYQLASSGSDEEE